MQLTAHFSLIIRNFAPVNSKTKRHIAAWVLLAVFVPMLLLSSVHIHPHTALLADSCTECVHHHCDGHLGQQSVVHHDCVLCQFLTLPAQFVAVATIVIVSGATRLPMDVRQYQVGAAFRGIVGLRAPPECLM